MKRSVCIGYKDVVIAIGIDVALHKLADGPGEVFERIFDDAKCAISTIQEQRYPARCRSDEGIEVSIRFEVHRPGTVYRHGCETRKPGFCRTVSELSARVVQCPEAAFGCHYQVKLKVTWTVVVAKLADGIIEVCCYNGLNTRGYCNVCGSCGELTARCGDHNRIGCFIQCDCRHVVRCAAVTGCGWRVGKRGIRCGCGRRRVLQLYKACEGLADICSFKSDFALASLKVWILP